MAGTRTHLMKLELDTEANILRLTQNGQEQIMPLYSTEGFEALSDAWLKVSWNQKYSYTFSWFGRPVIQHPEDMLRTAEVLFKLKPDFVVETGVAHGGSLVFYATLFEAMNKGRVIGVDIEIRPHNRAALEAHPLKHRIDLIEGSSTAPEIVREVRRRIPAGSTVLVILDSNHSKAHVAAELEAYHDLVSPGSYIVATDGIMEMVHDTPRGNPGWKSDNPSSAAAEFCSRHPEFELVQPPWAFNESELKANITCWPGAWLRRLGSGR